MKRVLGLTFALSLFVAGAFALTTPKPAAAGFEHCHLYTSGFACDGQCGPMEICCSAGYECETHPD